MKKTALRNDLENAWKDRQLRFLLLGLLGLTVLLACVTVTGTIYYFRPELAALLDRSSPEASTTCAEASLTIGTTRYLIQPLATGGDGSFSVPPDTPGAAYQVGDSDSHLFALSPMRDNLVAADSLNSGDLILVQWEGCREERFLVQGVEMGEFSAVSLGEQSAGGLSLLVQPEGGAGIALRAVAAQPVTSEATRNPESSAPELAVTPLEPGGAAVTEDLGEVVEFEIFQPRPGELLANVGIESVVAPEGGNTVEVSITIENFGISDIKVEKSDIGLFDSSGIQIAGVASSKPKLPETIKPGETEAFQLTFERGTGSLGVMRVFNVEFDLEDFR